VDVIAFARNHFESRARANQRDHRNLHLLRANRDETTFLPENQEYETKKNNICARAYLFSFRSSDNLRRSTTRRFLLRGQLRDARHER